MRAKDKMQVTLKVSTAQLHILVQCHPIEVVVGGRIVSCLCGGAGPQCPAGYVELQMDSVRVDTGVDSMVLTLKTESHNIMFMSLTGNNLLVQMRAKGNKSLNFWDILEICQR